MSGSLEIKEKYHELQNFLISYFGDYREGKSENEIIEEAKKENSVNYLQSIKNLISEFVLDNDYTALEKLTFIRDANLHFEKDQEAIEWLQKLEQLIFVSATINL